MKPFNVEIFDRNLNFKYSYLLDNSEFSYSEDAMDPVKNTIYVPTDFSPSTLDPNDGRAPRGWYLRILNDDIEIQGIITVFESEEDRGRLTFSQMITRLDLNMLVGVGDITQYSIENYIKKLITDEFINSSDAKQRIPGLSTVTTTSTTTGTFSYTDTDEEEVDIDFLSDLVYPAFELYSITTEVSFNPQSKTINITIGTKNETPKTIEADLPNISSGSFTIQKYSKEINKIDCFDIYQTPPRRTSYYLHPDGSWNSDSVNNRILPIVNSIVQLDGWAAAKVIIDAQLADALTLFQQYNESSATIPTGDYSRYTAFGNKVMPAYIAEHPLTAPSVSGATRVTIGSTGYEFERSTFEDYCSGASWALDHLEEEYTSMRGHCRLNARVTVFVESGDAAAQDYFFYEKPFTNSMASSALSLYKKTDAYTAEINAIYNTAVTNAMQARAKALFAKNKYSNLIELSMLADDGMIKPLQMELGNAASIIHKGVSYSSILSGREIRNGLATLTFGTIRLELTSFLKGRY